MSVGHRALGATGVDVSRIILGCGNFGGVGSAPEFFGQGESEAEAFALLDAAWDLGITTFDTADAYGGGRSEAFLGRWLATKRADERESVVVTTKVFHSVEGESSDSGLAPERIERSLERSLLRLGLDRIPLYMTHQPDPETPIHATLEELDRQVKRGTIGAFGASNIDVGALRSALAASAKLGIDRYEWIQNSYNLLEREEEREMLPLCEAEGLGHTPFGPLAGGWLAGRYRGLGEYPAGSRMTLRPEPYAAFETPATFAALARFADLAQQHGVEPAVLAIAWLLANTAVSAVVIGPRRPEQLEPAMEAVQLDLSSGAREQLAEIFGAREAA